MAEQMARLEQEAAQSSAALKECAEEAAAASQRAAASDAEVASLQAEVEANEKQIALLEVRLPVNICCFRPAALEVITESTSYGTYPTCTAQVAASGSPHACNRGARGAATAAK